MAPRKEKQVGDSSVAAKKKLNSTQISSRMTQNKSFILLTSSSNKAIEDHITHGEKQSNDAFNLQRNQENNFWEDESSNAKESVGNLHDGQEAENDSQVPPDTPRSDFETSTNSTIMSAMTTETLTLEEQVSIMSKALENIMKALNDRDAQMEALVKKVEQLGEFSQISQHQHRSQGNEGFSSKEQEKGNNIEFSPDGSIPVDQLKKFILGTVKEKYEKVSNSSFGYVKPYSNRIEQQKMPLGYQPPKFQQFDGKGNPNQHIAHFIETCNNAGTEGDLMVKQFVRTLEGNAFDWYCDLQEGSIDTWGQLEQEFMNRFYSTRRTLSLMELTNTRQWKDEPVEDYINRWRGLSLNCKDILSETSAIEMCIQCMHWGLLYILQGIKPRSFEELASRAHDMEVSISTSGDQTFSNLGAQNHAINEEGNKWSKTH